MSRLGLIACVAALVAVPGGAAASGQQAEQAQSDWASVVAETPEGGFRMGNPDAPLRIVEFVAASCDHCSVFAREGVPELIERFVRPGRASFEIRSLPLEPVGTAAAILNGCAAPEHYFPLMADILEHREAWLGRIARLSKADVAEIAGLSVTGQLERLAEQAGLLAIVQRHGVSEQRGRACLADANNLVRQTEMRRSAIALGVRQAPSFLLNGELLEGVHDWAALEARLTARAI